MINVSTNEESLEMKIPKEKLMRLEEKARNVCKNAHVPYSRFPVGAAVCTESGDEFVGCNVENASYGLTCCAERNAIFAAIAAGQKEIRGLVVYTPTQEPTMPCGACRQVLLEFGRNADVVCVSDGNGRVSRVAHELMPDWFGAEDL